MKGGGTRQNLFEFKEKLNKHRHYIFYLFCLCFTTIIYLCFSMMPSNKKFIGGEASFTDNMKNQMNQTKNDIITYLNNLLDEIIKILSEKSSQLEEKKWIKL